MKNTFVNLRIAIQLSLALIMLSGAISAQKPNILVIWGDDVGQSNISAYTRGLMGFKKSAWQEVFGKP